MGDLKITDDSRLGLFGDDNRSRVHLDLHGVKDAEPLHLDIDEIAPLRVQSVAPVAVHLKEVHQIDPLSIESLKIDQVANIDPIQVTRFNVTNLPTVNVCVRQLPTVHMSVGHLPAISVGTHQSFRVPSDYTVRAAVLGIELSPISLAGTTQIIPVEQARREQARVPARSQPLTATAGNPAIPSTCRETSATISGSGASLPSQRSGVRPALRPPTGVSIGVPRRGTVTGSVNSGG